MKSFLLLLLLVPTIMYAQENRRMKDLAKWVNPLVGTMSKPKLSNGNTYPAIALPWGMNFWTPQTGKMGNGWEYQYTKNKIVGFKETHQPSPWIGDYGAFSIMPVAGQLKYKEDDRGSWFSHKRETVRPYYYRVFLGNYATWVEMTATTRAAYFRITYPAGWSSYLVLDAFFQGSYVKVIPEKDEIIGYCRNNSGGVPDNFHNYFILKFDHGFKEVWTWEDSSLYKNTLERKGDHVGAVVEFKGLEKKVIDIKVASSFISYDQARLNLEREIGNATFEQIKERDKEVWNKELNRIRIEGASDAQKTTFYTALYHSLLFPRKFYEINKEGKIVHYSPYNGKVLPGYMFTDNGFWDTFRSLFPFLTVMYPDMDSHMMAGLVNTYKEGGWLPEWASPGYRNSMIGDNAASIIADSYLMGIKGYDIDTLYKGLLKDCNNEGPFDFLGRVGAKYYNSLGYIPSNVGIDYSVTRTLEYSFDDWSMMKLAEALHKPKAEIDKFAKRAFNYRNVFDKSVNFMRGRNADGTWQTPFIADKWGGDFIEGSAWQWTWSVLHDPQGLINLMGGERQFTDKLDSFMTALPTFGDSFYHGQIHEMTEMMISGQGQYDQGNEPSFHILYLYDYAGEPWKAQRYLRQTMRWLYAPNPNGLPGDDDEGEMSAWYVFSSFGFYPVCPGSGQFVIGSPLFKKVTLMLENGKKFVVEARNNSGKNVYIDRASLNGVNYTKDYITYKDIMAGDTLSFKMSSVPNKEIGIKKQDLPYSYSSDFVPLGINK